MSSPITQNIFYRELLNMVFEIKERINNKLRRRKKKGKISGIQVSYVTTTPPKEISRGEILFYFGAQLVWQPLEDEGVFLEVFVNPYNEEGTVSVGLNLYRTMGGTRILMYHEGIVSTFYPGDTFTYNVLRPERIERRLLELPDLLKRESGVGMNRLVEFVKGLSEGLSSAREGIPQCSLLYFAEENLEEALYKVGFVCDEDVCKNMTFVLRLRLMHPYSYIKPKNETEIANVRWEVWEAKLDALLVDVFSVASPMGSIPFRLLSLRFREGENTVFSENLYELGFVLGERVREIIKSHFLEKRDYITPEDKPLYLGMLKISVAIKYALSVLMRKPQLSHGAELVLGNVSSYGSLTPETRRFFVGFWLPNRNFPQGWKLFCRDYEKHRVRLFAVIDFSFGLVPYGRGLTGGIQVTLKVEGPALPAFEETRKIPIRDVPNADAEVKGAVKSLLKLLYRDLSYWEQV